MAKFQTARFWLTTAYTIVLGIIALCLVVGGGRLVWAGGTIYYLMAGIGLSATAILYWRNRRAARLLYVALLGLTIAWSLWEVGNDSWQLVPRLAAWFIVGTPLLASSLWPRDQDWRNSSLKFGGLTAIIGTAVLFGFGLHSLRTERIDPKYQAGTAPYPMPQQLNRPDPGDAGIWPHWGGSHSGTRHSDAAQITPANISGLRPAWKTRIALGNTARQRGLSSTPILAEGRLYACNNASEIFALEPDTGKILWSRKTSEKEGKTCRGVSALRVEEGDAPCSIRIFATTGASQLVALDSVTGQSCKDFGEQGAVALTDGLNDAPAGYYHVTSAPTVVRGRIVVGGWVSDGQYWGEPSGVIRAFDAKTGELHWAWDMGHPDRSGAPANGETYTPATPNSWAPMSADEELGLVFVPMGNATPDYYGAQRRAFDDKYSSAVVALDVQTGKVRWHFQTTHHDLWDYDIASQPMLVEIPSADGKTDKAVVQMTKRGEIFVLDRATGVPLRPVNEHPVANTPRLPGERYSPTQPFSDAMPSFRGPYLEGRDMWGLTPLDQMWCRLALAESRYDGQFTPPGTDNWISFPGFVGGMNWGSGAYNGARGVLIFPAVRLAMRNRLIPRAEADSRGLRPVAADANRIEFGKPVAQKGTPYAADAKPFMSVLGIPCQAPPFGTLNAVDLVSGRLIWSRPLGGPANMGMPVSGGAISTASGVTFVAGTPDGYFRAIESKTGNVLWKTALPRGAFATPMTFLSPVSGRQFVVISVGGTVGLGGLDDAELFAFALKYQLIKRAKARASMSHLRLSALRNVYPRRQVEYN